jgi:hypothetical protein
MISIKLSTLAIALGLGTGLPHVYGLMKPAAFSGALRRFPRSMAWGWSLMLLATAWFIYNLSLESISDFASYKNVLFLVFAGVGIGSCLFVQDFLAVRGLAVLFLLLAKLMVDTGRPKLQDTSWVLVIQVWAYVLVILGMWLTISPWRLRDFVEWRTANEKRLKTWSAGVLVFGLCVAGLGLFKFQ